MSETLRNGIVAKDFADALARVPQKAKHVRDRIKDLLLRKRDCYLEMEPYLIEPGVSGSKYFDQHYAVLVLLKYDAANGKHVASFRLTEKLLYNQLVRVLKEAGFLFKYGRIIGLKELEYQEEAVGNDAVVERTAVDADSD